MTPGSPGSIRDREVRWALSAASRRRNRNAKRTTFPFRYGRVLVTLARPVLPYGRSTHARGFLSHIADSIFLAWRSGRFVEAAVRWRCGAMSAYFELIEEPNSPVCPVCTIERQPRP